MKPLHFIAPAALVILGAAVWFARQTSEAASLRAELESLRGKETRRIAKADESGVALRSLDENFAEKAELHAALAREAAELAATEKSLAEVRKAIPPVGDGETVVSFGRITDMGQEAAQAIRGVVTLFDEKREGLPKEQVQASFMKLMAWMPEIAGFEERPAEIACFQATVLGDLFALEPARIRDMEAIIKTHFAALQAQRLTAASSAQPNWRERRAAALTPLLWQLRPFIPPKYSLPGVLTQIVNVGAGFETKSETHFSSEPGKSSHTVSMTLPSWPQLPWLAAKSEAAK